MTLKDWFDSTFSIEANGFYGSEEARILLFKRHSPILRIIMFQSTALIKTTYSLHLK